MIIPPNYTPVQITVTDDNDCITIYNIWSNIYFINKTSYSYISHLSLARKYNLIYALIKTDNLKEINYPYTTVPLISAENIEFYKLDRHIHLVLKEENDIKETINYTETQFWYKNGNLHRDNDLPAVIHTSGRKEWFKDGYLHRDNDLPAIIYDDGKKEWYQNGEIHRDNDLPAAIYSNGRKEWYKDGNLHRDNDLPAIIYFDGSQSWYKDGVRYAYPS